jgi:hypothetical protein
MGIGRNKSAKALFVGVFIAALSLSVSAVISADNHRSGIWKVLRDGHFSGAMDRDAKVAPIGIISVGSRYYQLMHFEWAETPILGREPHGQSRLLVFERTKERLVYLGSYVTPGGRPRIEGRMVVFPYREYEILGQKVAKTIVFDEKGPPPKAYLDGEQFSFAE